MLSVAPELTVTHSLTCRQRWTALGWVPGERPADVLKESRRPDSQETAWATEKHRDPGVVSGGEEMMGSWGSGQVETVCVTLACAPWLVGGLGVSLKSAAAQPEN